MHRVPYPTFESYDEGDACENRDNAEEAVNKLRKLVSDKDNKAEEIVLSRWRQHSLRKDEYILVKSQSIKDAIIRSTQEGDDTVSFVMQSLDNTNITSKEQTDAETQEE